MDTARTLSSRIRKITPLKRALFDAQLTQAELARRVGMDQGFLSHIVNGRHPSDHHAELIANALCLQVNDLWPEQEAA